MKALLTIAALALASAGLAAPAFAQSAAAPTDAISARFLTLKDPLIGNIGTADTVIMIYAAFDGDLADPGQQIFVRFLAPDGKSVRSQGVALGPVVDYIFHAAVYAYATDPKWRSATVVIDHGKASVTMRHVDDFDASKAFIDRVNEETARVFHGLPVEAYHGPGS
jgi:hypothetical protein